MTSMIASAYLPLEPSGQILALVVMNDRFLTRQVLREAVKVRGCGKLEIGYKAGRMSAKQGAL